MPAKQYEALTECRTCHWEAVFPRVAPARDLRAALGWLENVAHQHLDIHPDHEVRIAGLRRSKESLT